MRKLSDQEISKLNDLTIKTLSDKTKINGKYFNSILPELVGIKELQITAKTQIMRNGIKILSMFYPVH